MRRHDPQAQEDGFALLASHAGEHVDDLIAEFGRERDDPGLRRWLLELVAAARSPTALPLLVEQLSSDDESLREWARTGLELLGTKQARHELWRAREDGRLP